MDYEKKYKEALERAREALNEIPLESYGARKIIIDAFPELAESDDERIRKHLVGIVELYWGKTNDPDKAKDLAWLKKQKENIEKEYVFRPLAGTDITIAAEQAIRRANKGDRLVLAFNGAYIPIRKGCNANKIVEIYDAFIEKQKDASKAIEAVERIDKYIDEHLANAHDMKDSNPDKKYYRGWDDALGKMAGILQDVYSIEKQKENPKNTDSIPEDCVSVAKCEDRWYKVEDFLPDSGRDVLAKDALGNFLIANYDGDRWYISGYDNEDKPIVYTPAIKEWCDIPSEKQKEPQNKSMAHEDSSWPGILTSPLCKDKNLDDIAQEYVEGVKEYNPTPDWNLIHTAVCYGYHLAEQKEQKPVEKEITLTDFEEVLNTFLFNFAHSSIEDCEPKEYIRKYSAEILKAAYKELNAQLKQDIFEAQQEGRREGYDAAKAEQKPAEWSEEDEKMRERLITRLNWITYNTRTDGTSPNITFLEEIDWLKSLRPQPHWKPSEEQMSMLLAVIRDPNNAGSESCSLAFQSLYEDLHKL